MRLFPKFTRRMFLKSGSIGLFGLSFRDSLLASTADDADVHYAQFVNPPDDARPAEGYIWKSESGFLRVRFGS